MPNKSNIVVIEPHRGWQAIDFGEIWRYRELLYSLAWRDLKAKYRQTVLGVLWAVIRPFVSMLVFTIIFGKLAGIRSDGAPYAVFSYAALLPWGFFSGVLQGASNSLLGNSQLITKVYFPRAIIPLSGIGSPLVDFLIGFLMFGVLMLWFQFAPGIWIVAVLPLLVLSAAVGLGVGLWLAALNVRFRDVQFVVPFLVQIWMYATPIVYPLSMVPDKYILLWGLNPMVGVIEGFRWAMIPGWTLSWGVLCESLVLAVLLLVSGAYFFRRMERTFADLV